MNLVWVITPFTTQIFEFFIASTFIYESIRDLFQPIQLKYSTNDLLLGDIDATTNTTRELSSDVVTDPNEGGGVLERSSAYAGLVIGIGTFYLCWILHFAETWRSFNTATRSFLASYNMMISLIVMTSLSYIPGVDQGITNTNSSITILQQHSSATIMVQLTNIHFNEYYNLYIYTITVSDSIFRILNPSTL